MTTLTATSADPATLKVDAVVVAVAQGRSGLVLSPSAASLERVVAGGLVKALTALGATGRLEEVTCLPTLGAINAPVIAAVGMGPAPARGSRYCADVARRAAGASVRALAGSRRVALTLTDSAADAEPESEAGNTHLRAVAEGALLGAYSYDRFRVASRADQRTPVQEITLITRTARSAATKTALARAGIIADAVALCRDLVNTPPGHLRPQELAEASVHACRPLGLDVTVLDDKALRKEGYGGLLGVGAGSIHPPRLVRIAYTHPQATRSVHLVGKGITFDSGGLSLKPSNAMETMKMDMGGAAAVLAAMTAVARLDPAVNVVGWLPTAENLPSGTAIRPSDVLTMYGGRTVEVLNTDAEGRLILADAIARAGEERPDVLLDVATLTGAQMVALGSRTAGVMANDDELRDHVVAAAGRAGESMWPMPLPPDLRKGLDSDVADIKNVADRNGGMLIAGLFLQEFVADGIRWAHLDIAGPAFNTAEAWGCTPKGGTGAAVRTFVQVIEDLAEADRSSVVPE